MYYPTEERGLLICKKGRRVSRRRLPEQAAAEEFGSRGGRGNAHRQAVDSSADRGRDAGPLAGVRGLPLAMPDGARLPMLV
jgi:hypothetical protein